MCFEIKYTVGHMFSEVCYIVAESESKAYHWAAAHVPTLFDWQMQHLHIAVKKY